MAKAKKTSINEGEAYDPYTSRGPSAVPESDTTEHPAPPINSELTPAERKALFMDHYRPIAAQLEIVNEAKGEYNRLRKLAKADKIKLADIDFALRCAEVDDGNIIVDDLRRQSEIAAWFALPVEYQPDMFGDFNREPSEDRARREGRKAGATGVGSNPYDENSEPGKAWAEAWSGEQKIARAALVVAMTKRNELIKGADNGEDPFGEESDDDHREAAE
ncbi:hypothetical protein [Mesorhizobium sp. M0088]|uniref:hypothetical protein n=1 Tax=Mesorhizobium sp. M0088 TaxID=2956873 RepID=UPI00333AE0D2